MPALAPLYDLGITDVACTTYQAISGAGKTFKTFPDIVDNCIPFISGEEENQKKSHLRFWSY